MTVHAFVIGEECHEVTSEGCVLYALADACARVFNSALAMLYQSAYPEEPFDQIANYLDHPTLAMAWGGFTVLPERWDKASLGMLCRDLEAIGLYRLAGHVGGLVRESASA